MIMHIEDERKLTSQFNNVIINSDGPSDNTR